jgi:cardiolipin synthase
MGHDSILGWLAWAAYLVLAIATAGHALLFRRDPRSALGWIVACFTLPYFGALVYLGFGINRVQRRAQSLFPEPRVRLFPGPPEDPLARPETGLECARPDELGRLCHAGWALTRRAAVGGNHLAVLSGGEAFFERMLQAIGEAEHWVLLQSYIFGKDRVGEAFIGALGDAVDRGVTVRVLLDGVGTFYGPRVTDALRERGVAVELFLPVKLFPIAPLVNLRNHRKLLSVDGEVAFTGGANISARHLMDAPDVPFPTHDLQFEIHGPLVTELERVFRDDWLFATGERLPERDAHPQSEGDAIGRVITDGPDDDLDKLLFLFISAVSEAEENVVIRTPYFLPPRELLTALSAAALRGVRVQVLLPERSNLVYVDWATRNMLWEPLQRGVEIRLHPGPFSHSKLFAIDGKWAFVGSPNLDPRSLRLNFEAGVEVYDAAFTRDLVVLWRDAWEVSHPITLEDVDGRSVPARIRDSIAWLAWPYL